MALNFVKLSGLICLILLCLPSSADIHEKRTWTFKNGEAVELEFVNAYGWTAYFYDGSKGVNAAIHTFSEADQADIVIWSRNRDQEIEDGSLPQTDFTRRFREDARRLVDHELVRPDWTDAKEPDFYAIYTSASWCGPCKRFTPRLVAGYNSSKALHGDRFELLLCSWDQTLWQMKDYMEENQMPWFGNWANRKDHFWRQYQATGIPCLVIVDRIGYVLSHSYTKDDYIGPEVPLRKLYELLTHTIDRPAGRLSVRTPGIDNRKLSELIHKQQRQVQDSGEDSPPFPLIQPVSLLQKLQDPDAEKVLLKLKVKLDSTGVVRSTELMSHDNEKLASELDRALCLWQFMPKVTVNEGPVPCEVLMPLSLKVNL